MKKTVLILTILTGFIFTACGRNAEVSAFISDSNKLANGIVEKVMTDPNISGIEAAQKLLDGKKADLKAKFANLKNVRGFQVKSETTKLLTDITLKNVKTVNDLKLGFAGRIAADRAFSKKMNKLIADYNALYAS